MAEGASAVVSYWGQRECVEDVEQPLWLPGCHLHSNTAEPGWGDATALPWSWADHQEEVGETLSL